MSPRPIVLVFNKCYLPGYLAGGPIKTIENIVDRLGDDFDFRIVTLDRDSGSNVAYEGITYGEWHVVGKAKVMYLSPKEVSIRLLCRLYDFVQPQVIYLNSFFDSVFTQRVLMAKRLRRLKDASVVLAPRGEFSDGALGLKSVKKRVYIRLAFLFGLYRQLVWQASSEIEKQDILSRLDCLKSDEIQVANDLAPLSVQSTVHSPRVSGAAFRVCFLSRICPMKNLDYALEVLAEVKFPVMFTIYGPQEVPAYWEKCEALIAKLPENITVDYCGSVHPSSVRTVLAKHDLFFLPTLGENYGHAIYEALSVGLPVLISDNTPWNDIAEHNVGWEYSLGSRSEFVKKIEELYAWSPAQHRDVAKRAVEYSKNVSQDAGVIKQNLDLFNYAVNNRFC